MYKNLRFFKVPFADPQPLILHAHWMVFRILSGAGGKSHQSISKVPLSASCQPLPTGPGKS